jgi:hypothetical protein
MRWQDNIGLRETWSRELLTLSWNCDTNTLHQNFVYLMIDDVRALLRILLAYFHAAHSAVQRQPANLQAAPAARCGEVCTFFREDIVINKKQH